MAWLLSESELVQHRKQFWAKVQIGDLDECWPWIGALTGYTKYGHMAKLIDGKIQYARAHRVALQMAGITVRHEDFVLHSCDYPRCCNPFHLRVGTRDDNARDRAIRQGYAGPVGEQNHFARLNTESVVQIRRLLADGATHAVLAAQFGVAQTTIGAIGRRETWKHVA